MEFAAASAGRQRAGSSAGGQRKRHASQGCIADTHHRLPALDHSNPTMRLSARQNLHCIHKHSIKGSKKCNDLKIGDNYSVSFPSKNESTAASIASVVPEIVSLKRMGSESSSAKP